MSLDFILLGTEYTGEFRQPGKDKYHIALPAFCWYVFLMSAQIAAKRKTNRRPSVCGLSTSSRLWMLMFYWFLGSSADIFKKTIYLLYLWRWNQKEASVGLYCRDRMDMNKFLWFILYCKEK